MGGGEWMGRKLTHSGFFGETDLFSAFSKNSSGVSEAERMLAEFVNRSNVGLAIFDDMLCYRMCNPYLAASNGAPIESHLGKHVREILGEVGLQVEPALRQVFATRQPVLNCELAGALPTKPEGGHWMDTFFPIANSNGDVKQVGAFVVELGKDIRFEPAETQGLPANTLLRSWKEIAQYLRTSIKTVQRWERAYEFPVRRVRPNKGSVVFAVPKEIDDWLQSRNLHTEAMASRFRKDRKRP